MRTNTAKRISIVLTIILVMSLMSLLMVACSGDGGQSGTSAIEVPANVGIDATGLLTWDRVSGADSYELDINGSTVTSKFTRYDLYSHEDKPQDGIFRVKVRAVDKEGNKSDWSKEVTFTIKGGSLMYPVITGVTDGILQWLPNSDATGIVFTVNGEVRSVSVTDSSYDLTQESGNKLTVSIMYKGDGVYYQDSSTATIIYYATTGVMQLPAPTNVRMEGQTLVFDAVVGADMYYLTDYNNTVTTVNTNMIDMSSGFLTLSVSAGNSSGYYEQSEQSMVEYFTEGQGTQDSPFVITTADEWRYIEFYESFKDNVYYELGNDIVFEPIELAEDEAGSNTYKLGSFSGVLDGKGYSLVNLTVYYRDGYSSLFTSITSNAVIKNLVIENADWRTWTVKTNDGIMHEKGGDVAIICFTNRGTIDNITVKNSSIVAVVDGAASLVSINYGTVSNCTVDSDVTISGNKETGGIVIHNAGTVTDCINSATINGNVSTGGIAGRNAGSIVKCYNYGTISAKKRVGGIVGYNYNISLSQGTFDHDTLVEFCANFGTVNGSTEVGGIAGRNGSDGVDELGIISPTTAGVYYSYNQGAVYGTSIVGGVVGNNFDTTTMTSGKTFGVVGCYNIGKVSTNENFDTDFTRIFLDAGVTNDWITADNAVIYCHYWGSGGSTTWPGEKMTQLTIDGKYYYYIDIPKNMMDGIIFARCDLAGNTVYNQTKDMVNIVGNMYSFTTDFDENGTWSNAPSNVVNSVQPVFGGIAGYNTRFVDCYYLDSACQSGSHANGSVQPNKVIIGSVEYTGGNVARNAQYISSQDFVDLLNKVAGDNVWAKGDNAPKFSWQ